MMNRRLIFYIIAGLVSFMLLIIQKKKYSEIPVWKMLVMTVWIPIAGVIAVKLLSFVEKGSFGGDSWFGAVLFMPVLMSPLLILKIPYKRLMNLYAPTQTLVFAVEKIDCYISGCCFGRYLPSLGIQFPSQIADMVIGVVATAVLLWIEHRKPNKHLYPLLMVIFGGARFVVDWFRYVEKPWKWILPPTIIWSLLSVVIGCIWLVVLRRKQNGIEKQR